MTFIKLPVETFKPNEELESLGIDYDMQFESTDIYVRKDAITMFCEREEEGVVQIWINNSDDNITIRMGMDNFMKIINKV